MFRLLNKKKAQSTAEYAVLIALVVAAVVGMQTYVKRGMQGRVKDAGDDFTTAVKDASEWGDISSTPATLSKQYEHEKLTSQSTQNILEDQEASAMAEGGKVTRESVRRTEQAAGDFQKYDY